MPDSLDRTGVLQKTVLDRLSSRLAPGAREHLEWDLGNRPPGSAENMLRRVFGAIEAGGARIFAPGHEPPADWTPLRMVLAALPVSSDTADRLARDWHYEMGEPDHRGNAPGLADLAVRVRAKLAHPDGIRHLAADARPGPSYGARQVRAVLDAIPGVSPYKVNDDLTERWASDLARSGLSGPGLAQAIARRLRDPYYSSQVTRDGQPVEVNMDDPVFTRGPQFEGDEKVYEGAREATVGL